MDQPVPDATTERVKRPDQRKPSRTFGVLDAMILVGAAAAGATSIRPFLLYGREMVAFFREYYLASGSFVVYSAYSDSAVKFLEPWLASWTLAFLAIRLRQPRPRFHRLMRQPGTVACVAAAFVIIVEAIMAFAVLGIVGVPPLEDFYIKMLPYLLDSAAIAVVAVWTVAILAGRWKPESGWIDRMGRLIGALWIVIFILASYFVYLFPAATAKYAPPAPSPAQDAMQEQQRAMQEKLREDQLNAEAQRTKDLERLFEELKQEGVEPQGRK